MVYDLKFNESLQGGMIFEDWSEMRYQKRICFFRHMEQFKEKLG